MSAFQEIWNGFDLSALWSLLFGVLPALLCITLHEMSHGYTAWLLGDPTAKEAGRLSFNPLKHLDPMGFLMLVVAHVGWAKPVPVNMYRFKNPKRGMALTALAGPVSNFIIALVFLFLTGLCYPFYYRDGDGSAAWALLRLCSTTAQLSLGLGLFNLLPVPPLDGSKVLFALIPDESYRKLMRYERYGMILIYALAFFGVTGRFLSLGINAVLDVFWVLVQWGAELSWRFFL